MLLGRRKEWGLQPCMVNWDSSVKDSIERAPRDSPALVTTLQIETDRPSRRHTHTQTETSKHTDESLSVPVAYLGDSIGSYVWIGRESIHFHEFRSTKQQTFVLVCSWWGRSSFDAHMRKPTRRSCLMSKLTCLYCPVI